MGTTWLQHRQPSRIFTHKKNSYCVFGGISLVSCIMSCSNRTRPLLGALYRTQLMRLSRALKEKRAHYYSRHDKIILLHDNARPHVAAPVNLFRNTQMRSSTPSAVFSRHCSFRLLLVPIDDAWLV